MLGEDFLVDLIYRDFSVAWLHLGPAILNALKNAWTNVVYTNNLEVFSWQDNEKVPKGVNVV